MRARGGTVYAKQSPLKKPNTETMPPSSLPIAKTKPVLNSEEFTKMFEDFGPMNFIQYKDNFTGDFQKPDLNSKDDCCSTTSTISNSMGGCLEGLSRASSTFSNYDIQEEQQQQKGQKLFRGMIIGSESVDKQALVNSIYPLGETETNLVLGKRQKFDLITRKIEKESFNERYHFWLKEAEGQESQHLLLLNTYYKACSVFFLIYDMNDTRSWNILELEIMQIQKANNKEVIFALVVNSSEDSNKTAFDELLEFRKKHQINILLEMDKIAQKREEVKNLLESFAK